MEGKVLVKPFFAQIKSLDLIRDFFSRCNSWDLASLGLELFACTLSINIPVGLTDHIWLLYN